VGQNIGLVKRAGEEKRIDYNNIHLRSDVRQGTGGVSQ